METLKSKVGKAFKEMKSHGYKNAMQSPKIEKVIVSVGVGSMKDKNKIKVVEDRLMVITGQKASPRGAKVAIARFKSRQGDIVGYQVTLRGARHVRLPRETSPHRTSSYQGLQRNIEDLS